MIKKSHMVRRNRPSLLRWLPIITNEDGSAAVEFGIVAPIFFLLIAGIVQFGFTFGNYLFLTSAVMAGSQTLSVSRGIAQPWTSTVNAMVASAPLLTPAQLTPNIKVTINGTSCSADTTCAATLTAATGQPAVVTATYPCNLTFLGVNYAPGCTLASQVAQIIQ